jgi:branched-chain amino acid transport system ATP-binding protein
MGRNRMGKSTLIRSMLGFVAPLVAREIWRVIGDLRGHGIAALIVDRNYQAVTAVADRCVILVKGRVVFDGDSEALLARAEFLHRHLGV